MFNIDDEMVLEMNSFVEENYQYEEDVQVEMGCLTCTFSCTANCANSCTYSCRGGCSRSSR